MKRAAAALVLGLLGGCDWLSAADAQAQYCAEFSRGPANDEQRALLQACASSSDCVCPNSLCLKMQLLDGGVDRRCNPPDNAVRACPLFYDSRIVLWESGDDCLTSCPLISGAEKQCVGLTSGVHPCKLTGKCE